MTNRAPFKDKQGRPGGAPGKKTSGASFFNIAPGLRPPGYAPD